MPTKLPLSVVIIAKNEEKRIDGCIRSVAWAEEVIVVNDESTDRTVELAQKLGAKVFNRKMDIEGRQRNFGYSQATKPWILSLDADERVTPELASEIQQVISKYDKNLEITGFSIPILTFIGPRPIRGAGYYPARKTRLFRKGKFLYEETGVHPRAVYKGKIVELNHPILHYSCANLGEWIRKFDRETTLEAEKWIQDGRKIGLVKVLRKTVDRFARNYFLKNGWKEGLMGFTLCLFHGFYQLLTYAKYRERKKTWVVFIDRDGVINVDPIGDYVKSWEEFRFHDGVLEGLRRLTHSGYKIILISNQAGVGDGIYPENSLWDIHCRMLEVFQKEGIQIYAAYYCLHGKQAGCECRKPNIGLFRQATQDGLSFDRNQTYFIGDKLTDIQAGKSFGLKTILVRTGHGRLDEPKCSGPFQPDVTVNDFQEAVQRILCE